MALHLSETEVQYNRIKISNTLTELYYLPYSANGTVMVFCYGIPSHPFDRFPFGLESYLSQGYILAYPHYEGTFGSDGVCTLENAVGSIVMTTQAVLDEDIHDLISGEQINIGARRVILVGGSFGGSVALLAAVKSNKINTVISVAGPTDYRGRDFSKLEDKLKRAYKKEWNVESSVWKALAQGTININPVDYADKLRQKNTFLIHGADDSVVSPEHSIKLYEMLRNGLGEHQILIEPNVGHIGSHYIGVEHVHNSIESWLKTLLSL